MPYLLEDYDKEAREECLYAIHHIIEYVENIGDIDSLLLDHKTYDAVCMNFIVLGESASRISDNLKSQAPDIDWRAIKGFRNFVAHEYFGLDERIVWTAIQCEIPLLQQRLNEILESQ